MPLHALGNNTAPQTPILPLEPTVAILDRVSPEVISTNRIGIPKEDLLPNELIFGNSMDIAVNSTKNLISATSTINITPVNVLKKCQYPQRLPKSLLSPNPLLTSTLHTPTCYPSSTSNCITQSTTPTTPTPSVNVALHRGKRKRKKISKV